MVWDHIPIEYKREDNNLTHILYNFYFIIQKKLSLSLSLEIHYVHSQVHMKKTLKD